LKVDNQSAQIGTKNITVTTTRCSICRGKRSDKREAINRALGMGISYRDIEAMTGVAYRTIGNHAQHLPEIFKEAKDKGILEQPIDVLSEFMEQLNFAKDLRAAAAAWLRCPETGKITLEPRASEINVVYLDPSDLTQSGEMKKKKANLQILLDRIEGNKCEPVLAIVSTDIRKFAFDSLSAADTAIDKFAKIGGAYAKEVPPPPVDSFTDADLARELFRRLIGKLKWSEEDAVEGTRQKFPDVDIKLLTGGGTRGGENHVA
jgi:hypothetical protein